MYFRVFHRPITRMIERTVGIRYAMRCTQARDHQSVGPNTVDFDVAKGGTKTIREAVAGYSLRRSLVNARVLVLGRSLVHLVRVYGREWKSGQSAPNRLRVPGVQPPRQGRKIVTTLVTRN